MTYKRLKLGDHVIRPEIWNQKLGDWNKCLSIGTVVRVDLGHKDDRGHAIAVKLLEGSVIQTYSDYYERIDEKEFFKQKLMLDPVIRQADQRAPSPGPSI